MKKLEEIAQKAKSNEEKIIDISSRIESIKEQNDKETRKLELMYEDRLSGVISLEEYMKNAENLISLNSNTLLNDYFTNRDFTIFKIIDNAFESKNPSKYIYQNKNILDSVTLEYDDNENTSKIKSFIEY